MNTLPRIGLMLGDMTGIGPEISAKILAARIFKPLARIAVIGDARVLELGAKDARVDLKWKSYPDVDTIDWSRDEVPLVDLGNIDPATIKRAPDPSSSTARSSTWLVTPVGPAPASGDQLVPFQRAIVFAGAPAPRRNAPAA